MSFKSFEPTDEGSIILRSLSIMPVIRAYSWKGPNREAIEEQLHGEVQLRVISPKQGFVQTIESDKLHAPSYYDLAQRILDGVHRTTTPNQSNEKPKFNSIEDLTEHISRLIYSPICPGSGTNETQEHQIQIDQKGNSTDDDDDEQFRVQVILNIPKLIRFANGISLSIHRRMASTFCSELKNHGDYLDKIFIDQITTFAIIGLLPRERLQKQKVICSLTIFKPPYCLFPHQLDLFQLSESVFDKISTSEFYTVEALADSIANLVINQCNIETVVTRKVRVRIEKPEAVSCALGAGVEITRSI